MEHAQLWKSFATKILITLSRCYAGDNLDSSSSSFLDGAYSILLNLFARVQMSIHGPFTATQRM